jgi:hypothetical protein
VLEAAARRSRRCDGARGGDIYESTVGLHIKSVASSHLCSPSPAVEEEDASGLRNSSSAGDDEDVSGLRCVDARRRERRTGGVARRFAAVGRGRRTYTGGDGRLPSAAWLRETRLCSLRRRRHGVATLRMRRGRELEDEQGLWP